MGMCQTRDLGPKMVACSLLQPETCILHQIAHTHKRTNTHPRSCQPKGLSGQFTKEPVRNGNVRQLVKVATLF